MPRTEHQTQGTWHQAPSTKHSASNVRHQAQGTKQHASRAKHRAPTINRHAPGLVLQGGLGRDRVQRARPPIAGVAGRTCARRWVGFRGLPPHCAPAPAAPPRKSGWTGSLWRWLTALLRVQRGWASLSSEALGSCHGGGRSPQGRGAPHPPGHAAGDELARAPCCTGHRWRESVFALSC